MIPIEVIARYLNLAWVHRSCSLPCARPLHCGPPVLPAGHAGECSTSAIAFDMKLHLKGLWPPCRVPGDCGADHGTCSSPRPAASLWRWTHSVFKDHWAWPRMYPEILQARLSASCFFFLVHKPAWPYFHWSYMSRDLNASGVHFLQVAMLWY